MKSYSRRELYALGETLGDSATKHKLGGGRIYGGGGGGGQAPPTQSYSQTSNIPEYAEPYVTNMLSSAQTQIYDDGMSTFRPYKPYSSDVNNYFAGFSPMQTQAQQAAGQMQVPGQFAAGTGLAGAAGLGQLGTAGQAGMLGQMGLAGSMPAFGAGQQYTNQVTNPNAVAQYMSPYQQQVTDIAKTDAVRNAQLAQQQANLGASRQGTYGGARQALAQSEREKNLMSNLSNIQAQGSQSAYDRAIQSQQFGSNLGLQGIQTGLQGVGQGLQGVGAQQAGYAGAGQAAATLGGLGSQQQAANINQINLQSQMGGQQQQLEQNKINQAIQDYATQQQYPFMQLGMMNALLRGLPLQQTTTQQYQAQPGIAQQAMGLGLGAAGLSKAFGS